MLQLMLFNIFFALLVDRRIHKKAQQHRRRAVDGHGYRSGRVAQVKARIQFLGIIQVAMLTPELPILP